jgi:outer membrane protein TolC
MTDPRTTLTVALCLVATLTAHAADITTPALPTDIPSTVEPTGEVLALSLDDAWSMALARNLDLQIGRYDVAISDADVQRSVGIFDPVLTAGVNGDSTTSPSASVLEGAAVPESRNTRFNLGVGALLPTGTQLSLDARTTRSETNSEFAFVNPSWTTSLTAGLTQPLLRDFGTLVNRAGLILAQNGRDQTAVGFEISVINIMQEVELAYWDLAAARAAITVRQQSLDLAQQLLDETRERVNVGTSAPIDLVQSEATVAARLQDLIVARNLAGNAEDTLKSVLGFDEPREWMRPIETTEEARTAAFEPDLAEAIRVALAERPVLMQQELSLDALAINERLARNATLPALDLNARYGFSGLGGTINDAEPPIPTALKSGFGDSWDSMSGWDFPAWGLGVTFSMPIGNNEAEATLVRRRWELQQGEARLRSLQQMVIQQVRVAVRAISDGAANIEAALASVELADRNLEAEQTKFDNGLSTNYQVLLIQEDLAQAQLTLIQAHLSYRRALSGYRVATGTLLEDSGVEIVDPGAPDVPHDYWGDVEWLEFSDFETSADRVVYPAPAVGGSG